MRPCRPVARELAEAIIQLFKAQVDLEVKKQNEPDYMPTSTPADWCAEEQEKWNRIADKLWDAAHPGAAMEAARVVGGVGCREH